MIGDFKAIQKENEEIGGKKNLSKKENCSG